MSPSLQNNTFFIVCNFNNDDFLLEICDTSSATLGKYCLYVHYL